MKERWQIAIVGGTGGMGQLFVKELKPYADILIISRSLEKAKHVAERLGVQGGCLEDSHDADIVIVSVPIEYTYETCKQLLSIVKPKSLIIDIAAVKTHLKSITDLLPKTVSYISMHPLFGPEGSFKDYNVVLVPIKADVWLPKIQELLLTLGAQISTVSPEEHDLIMSKIQV
ncbi:MAG: prephenate dehydrogenase/arogenate dehydrogenase family protein, partial [Candidatus Helarchaeota archaeon]